LKKRWGCKKEGRGSQEQVFDSNFESLHRAARRKKAEVGVEKASRSIGEKKKVMGRR